MHTVQQEHICHAAISHGEFLHYSDEKVPLHYKDIIHSQPRIHACYLDIRILRNCVRRAFRRQTRAHRHLRPRPRLFCHVKDPYIVEIVVAVRASVQKSHGSFRCGRAPVKGACRRCVGAWFRRHLSPGPFGVVQVPHAVVNPAERSLAT